MTPVAAMSVVTDPGTSAARRNEDHLADELPSTRVRFAHHSELEFARLLDLHRVRWLYEPTTFVLERDAEGRPAQAFTPDFYLPDYDQYVEITTLNQKLVTKKNRKARRLGEVYPGTRVKVIYRRDYLDLMARFGISD
ncbi:MAG: hypothetical protein ACT4OS_06005 [Acidimicrobiales bacterium]